MLSSRLVTGQYSLRSIDSVIQALARFNGLVCLTQQRSSSYDLIGQSALGSSLLSSLDSSIVSLLSSLQRCNCLIILFSSCFFVCQHSLSSNDGVIQAFTWLNRLVCLTQQGGSSSDLVSQCLLSSSFLFCSLHSILISLLSSLQCFSSSIEPLNSGHHHVSLSSLYHTLCSGNGIAQALTWLNSLICLSQQGSSSSNLILQGSKGSFLISMFVEYLHGNVVQIDTCHIDGSLHVGQLNISLTLEVGRSSERQCKQCTLITRHTYGIHDATIIGIILISATQARYIGSPSGRKDKVSLESINNNTAISHVDLNVSSLSWIDHRFLSSKSHCWFVGNRRSCVDCRGNIRQVLH